MIRRTILSFLLAALITLTGCTQKAAPPKSPVTFYYPAAEVIYDGKTELLHTELREGAGYEENPEALLNLYLQGPESFTLRSPFPESVTVFRYATTANMAILVLSSEFAHLSGIELTVACACIASTLFDLTQLDRVQISALDSQLDGQASITLDRNNIYFVDTPSQPQDTGESTAP